MDCSEADVRETDDGEAELDAVGCVDIWSISSKEASEGLPSLSVLLSSISRLRSSDSKEPGSSGCSCLYSVNKRFLRDSLSLLSIKVIFALYAA